MANICSTTMRVLVYGDNATERAKEFTEKIREWQEKPFDETVKYPTWIGNLAKHAGVNPDRYSTRGNIDHIEQNGNEIIIDQEDAWSPNVEVWDAIMKKSFGEDYELRYRASEPGCLVFETNEEDLVGKYYVDNYDNIPEVDAIIGCEYEEVPEETVIILLETLFPEKKGAGLDELLADFAESDCSKNCAINRWERGERV